MFYGCLAPSKGSLLEHSINKYHPSDQGTFRGIKENILLKTIYFLIC